MTKGQINMTDYKLVPTRDDMIQCLLATRGQSEGVTADAILSMLTAAPAVQVEPDVSALVEAAESALGEIEDIMQEAYNSAYPVCCGRPGSECCGSPEPEWSEHDQNTIDRLAPHQRALTAALSAYRKGGNTP